MKFFKLFNFFMLILLASTATMASEIQAIVKLATIQAEKTSEEGGDELYFNITQYSSLGPSNETRIPAFPAHWLSKHLKNLKDVVLWKGPIRQGESIKLILSLLEQDNAPFDPDDALGGAQLQLQNIKGILKSSWVVPVFEEKNEVEMLKSNNPQGFVFKGDGSRYHVAFYVGQQ